MNGNRLPLCWMNNVKVGYSETVFGLDRSG